MNRTNKVALTATACTAAALAATTTPASAVSDPARGVSWEWTFCSEINDDDRKYHAYCKIAKQDGDKGGISTSVVATRKDTGQYIYTAFYAKGEWFHVRNGSTAEIGYGALEVYVGQRWKQIGDTIKVLPGQHKKVNLDLRENLPTRVSMFVDTDFGTLGVEKRGGRT